MCVAKTKALISCGFVFAYAKIRFSHDAAQIIIFVWPLLPSILHKLICCAFL